MKMSFGVPVGGNRISNPYGSLWRIMHGAQQQSGRRSVRPRKRIIPTSSCEEDPELQLGELGSISSKGYVALLRHCIEKRQLERGREVHGHIDRSGLGHKKHLGSLLVQLYAKCGCLDEARSAFDGSRSDFWSSLDTASCNALLVGYSASGRHDDARLLFAQMRKRDEESWESMLGAAAASGDVIEARLWFDKTPQHSSAAFKSIVAVYSQSGFLNNVAVDGSTRSFIFSLLVYH